MYLTEFRLLIASRRDGAQKKGELKMQDSPTMLLKTNEDGTDILTNATMLMKTNGLHSLTHDVDEKKGTWLKPQVEKRRWRRAPKRALVLPPRPLQPSGGGLARRNSSIIWTIMLYQSRNSTCLGAKCCAF